ncbi:MAG TPA: hypothetical protein VHF89_04900 [Solirubrobacteraceae bacterium]|nr:hypothetical protein [Solirubrobacteraceae bacterium]
MRRLPLALSAAGAALLLAAPAAVPAADVGSGSYTGGALGEQPALAYLLVARDKESFQALLTVRADCEGYAVPVQATVAIRDGRLEDDGTATVTKRITGDVTGPDGQAAKEDGEATVTLAVDPDGAAEGTMRLRSTFRDASTGEPVAECDTGSVPFLVMAVPPDAGEGRARKPRRGGLLLGVVDANPLVAEVRRSGRIERMAFLYRSGCQRKQRIVFVPAITPGRKGAFRVRGSQQLFTGEGSVEQVTFRMTGRYGRDGGLRGTLRVQGELEGRECDSGELKWRAAPAPRT